MTRLSTLEATEHFAELVERVASGKERIVLTQAGREVLALIPLEDLALVESQGDRGEDFEKEIRPPKPYCLEPASLGGALPGVDLDKALRLADALDDPR